MLLKLLMVVFLFGRGACATYVHLQIPFMNSPPITDKHTATGTRYFTGKPCKRGHIAERLVRSGACAKCLCERDRAVYAEQKASGVAPKKGRAKSPAEALPEPVALSFPTRLGALHHLKELASDEGCDGPVWGCLRAVIGHQLHKEHKWLSLPGLPRPTP